MYITGALGIVLVAAGLYLSLSYTPATPPAVPSGTDFEITSATSSAQETPSIQISNPVLETKHPQPLTLASGDQIVSWDFKGAYSDTSELISKAHQEITRLSDLIGKGVSPDMNLYVSIANQYDLLGDGKQEFTFLNKAVQAGGETAGLPWYNLGVLMEKLGALRTAQIAYEKASLVQPFLKQYQYAYLSFLVRNVPNEKTAIEKAFTIALKNLGQDSEVLILRSDWEQQS